MFNKSADVHLFPESYITQILSKVWMGLFILKYKNYDSFRFRIRNFIVCRGRKSWLSIENTSS